MGASDKELMLSVSDSKELDADRQVGALAEQSSQSVTFKELLEVVPLHNQATSTYSTVNSMCKHG